MEVNFLVTGGESVVGIEIPTRYDSVQFDESWINDDNTITAVYHGNVYEPTITPCSEFFSQYGNVEIQQLTHKSGTPPDTSLHLGDERRTWLQEQGGIQPTICAMIDCAMKRKP